MNIDYEKRDIQAEEEQEKLWIQFSGAPNSGKTLSEKARVLAPFLIGMGAENANSLFAELRGKQHLNIDDGKIGEVFVEVVFFYLHYVDRIAMTFLGLEKRNTFFLNLFTHIEGVLTKVYDGEVNASQFYNEFITVYAERQEEYGKYEKMLPEKDDGYKETLLWGVAQRVARVLDKENDQEVVTAALIYAWSAVKAMQIEEFFQGYQ